MAIKLITLNVEGNRHLEKVIPFLQKEKADVICLQEVLQQDVELFTQKLRMSSKFIPTMDSRNHLKEHFRGIWGLLFLTKEKVEVNRYYYFGEGKIPVYKQPNSGDRVLLYADVKGITIGTTHFTWTQNGEASDEQREHALKLLDFIGNKEMILCGDFNAPRGKEIFSMFEQKFKDNVPLDIDTTLDQELHFKKGLMYVVDSIFSTAMYNVSDVKVIDGISDHKAIIGFVEKNSKEKKD